MEDKRHKVEYDKEGRVASFWTRRKRGGAEEWLKWRVVYEDSNSNKPSKLIRIRRFVDDDGEEMGECITFSYEGLPLEFELFVYSDVHRRFLSCQRKLYKWPQRGKNAGQCEIEEWKYGSYMGCVCFDKSEVIKANYPIFIVGKRKFEKISRREEERDLETTERKERNAGEGQKPLPGLVEENAGVDNKREGPPPRLN